MESITKLCWGLIALIHLLPASVLLKPSLTETLYNVPPSGDVGVLLVHRGALFLAVMVAALIAAFDPSARKIASLIAAISMIGFLIVYARAGLSEGALRKIAVTDAIGLLPLIWVSYQAWRA